MLFWENGGGGGEEVGLDSHGHKWALLPGPGYINCFGSSAMDYSWGSYKYVYEVHIWFGIIGCLRRAYARLQLHMAW